MIVRRKIFIVLLLRAISHYSSQHIAFGRPRFVSLKSPVSNVWHGRVPRDEWGGAWVNDRRSIIGWT